MHRYRKYCQQKEISGTRVRRKGDRAQGVANMKYVFCKANQVTGLV